MSVKIDDFDLIKKDAEQDKGLIHEMRTVSRITTGAPRNLVEHRTVSAEGSMLKDVGRSALVVKLSGEIMGETAKQSMTTLRSKYEAGEPVSFASDITTLIQIQKVVIEQVKVFQKLGEENRFHYELLLREFVEPPPSDSAAPDQTADAEDDSKDDADLHGIRGKVLDKNGKPKKGVTVNVQSDSGSWQLTTDDSGMYKMSDPADGTYTITVQANAYKNKKRIVVIKKGS